MEHLAPYPTFIRPRDLARILGISPRTLKRWRRDGKVPPPLRLSSRVIGWDAETIRAWIQAAGTSGRKTHAAAPPAPHPSTSPPPPPTSPAPPAPDPPGTPAPRRRIFA